MTITSFSPTLLLSAPGTTEWIIILVAILVLFGGRKIPELARGIGKGIREFNDAKKGVKDEIESGMKTPQQTAGTTASEPSTTAAGTNL